MQHRTLPPQPLPLERCPSRPWLVLLLGCAGLALGCETITEKVTEKVAESAIEHAIEKQGGGEVQLDSSKGTLSVKTDKGSLEVNGAGGKVPDSWPKDVPIYPGSKVLVSMANEGQQVLSLETPDSPEKAVEYYKAQLASMKQEALMTTEQQSMLAYKDATGRRVQLSIGKESGGSGPNTNIALIVKAPKQ